MAFQCIWESNPSSFSSHVKLLIDLFWQLGGWIKTPGSIELINWCVDVVKVEFIIIGEVKWVFIVIGVLVGIKKGIIGVHVTSGNVMCINVPCVSTQVARVSF